MSATKTTSIHGPWRFRLVRIEDESGISGTGHVADGVQFVDGTCALRWLTEKRSTAIYTTPQDLEAIHGHGGKTVIEWLDQPPNAVFLRGANDCYQDRCEGVPFASVGGNPDAMNAPRYILLQDAAEYVRGYHAQGVELGWIE